MGHLVGMGLDFLDKAKGFEVGHHPFPRFVAIKAAIGFGSVVVDAGIAVEDIDRRHPGALADLEVIEVVRRGNLDRARAGLGIGIAVANDGNPPPHQRQHHKLADQGLIALVLGMDRHRGIAQHGLGTSGRDDDESPRIVLKRIAEVPEVALDLALLDFQIGNGGMQLGVPVDQPLVPIDQPLLVKLDKHPADGPVEALVHGEAFLCPVGRGAEAAELAGDGTAGFGLPFPNPLHELFAAEIVAGELFRRHLSLHHHLGGDARMIRAGLPERVQALHALPADEDVLKGVIEGVPHVQAAGDVRRRHHDAVGGGGGPGVGGEGPRVFPDRIETRFGLGRPIGLVQHRRTPCFLWYWQVAQ